MSDTYTPKPGWPGKKIGPEHNPYMLRFFIFKYRNWPRIYIHKFLRSDYERGLHDHPWWFVSIILKGNYIEHLPHNVARIRRRGSIAFHRATDAHRVQLFNGPPIATTRTRQPLPVWTLFISGPVVRQWGFWCKNKQAPNEHWVSAKTSYGCE